MTLLRIADTRESSHTSKFDLVWKTLMTTYYNFSDHVIIERESTNRHRTSENRVARDSRDSRDQRVTSTRDYDRPSTNKTSKTSITKITPLTEKNSATDSTNSSPVRFA